MKISRFLPTTAPGSAIHPSDTERLCRVVHGAEFAARLSPFRAPPLRRGRLNRSGGAAFPDCFLPLHPAGERATEVGRPDGICCGDGKFRAPLRQLVLPLIQPPGPLSWRTGARRNQAHKWRYRGGTAGSISAGPPPIFDRSEIWRELRGETVARPGRAGPTTAGIPLDGGSDFGDGATAAGGSRAVLCRGRSPPVVARTGSFSPAIPVRLALGAPLCPEICRNILPVLIWPWRSKRSMCAVFCMLWV